MPLPKISLLTRAEDRRQVTPPAAEQAEVAKILELTKSYIAFALHWL